VIGGRSLTASTTPAGLVSRCSRTPKCACGWHRFGITALPKHAPPVILCLFSRLRRPAFRSLRPVVFSAFCPVAFAGTENVSQKEKQHAR